jgi:hypothetical protein
MCDLAEEKRISELLRERVAELEDRLATKLLDDFVAAMPEPTETEQRLRDELLGHCACYWPAGNPEGAPPEGNVCVYHKRLQDRVADLETALRHEAGACGDALGKLRVAEKRVAELEALLSKVAEASMAVSDPLVTCLAVRISIGTMAAIKAALRKEST